MQRIYVYCRISTYQFARIIKVTCTGTTFNRRDFDKLLKEVYIDDTIVFDSISYMRRISALSNIVRQVQKVNKKIKRIFIMGIRFSNF